MTDDQLDLHLGIIEQTSQEEFDAFLLDTLHHCYPTVIAQRQ